MSSSDQKEPQINNSTIIIIATIILLGVFVYFGLNLKLNALTQTTSKTIENINPSKTAEK